jgi:hypothetical protein
MVPPAAWANASEAPNTNAAMAEAPTTAALVGLTARATVCLILATASLTVSTVFDATPLTVSTVLDTAEPIETPIAFRVLNPNSTSISFRLNLTHNKKQGHCPAESILQIAAQAKNVNDITPEILFGAI